MTNGTFVRQKILFDDPLFEVRSSVGAVFNKHLFVRFELSVLIASCHLSFDEEHLWKPTTKTTGAATSVANGTYGN